MTHVRGSDKFHLRAVDRMGVFRVKEALGLLIWEEVVLRKRQEQEENNGSCNRSPYYSYPLKLYLLFRDRGLFSVIELSAMR